MRHSLDSWTGLPLKRQHAPGRGTPEGVTEGVAVLNRHFSIAVRAIVKARHGIGVIPLNYKKDTISALICNEHR